MKKIIFCFVFILLIGFLSCKKEDPCQDCYKDIFHCKINGNYWEPYCEQEPLFGCNPISIQYYKDDFFLSITAKNVLKKNGLRITINKLSGDTTQIQSLKFYEDIYSDYSNVNDCIIYALDTSQRQGLKLISHDHNKRILKATFEFTAWNLCGDTLTISDGYFNLNY